MTTTSLPRPPATPATCDTAGTSPADVRRDILAGRISDAMSFTQRVWAVTARIDRGRVATYAQIARLLDSPRAARAVGNAQRTNPYAPDVPCHRVVASDGHLHGYAHGLARKRQLLQAEGVSVTSDRVDLARFAMDW